MQFRRTGNLHVLAVAFGMVCGAMALAGCASAPVTLTGDHPPAIDMTYKRAHPPHYPVSAVAAHDQGLVVLDVFVDPHNQVSKVEVEQSSGYPDLDAAAVAAARYWRYAAGVKNGKPYASAVRVPVRFSM